MQIHNYSDSAEFRNTETAANSYAADGQRYETRPPDIPPPPPGPNTSGREKIGPWGCLGRLLFGLCIIAAAVVVATILATASIIRAGMHEFNTSMSASTGEGDYEFSDISKKIEKPGCDSVQVLHMKINGTISFESGFSLRSEEKSAALFVRQLAKARKDEDIAGIILEIDSPGGEVTAADAVWHELCRFRESGKNRFVIVVMGSTGASGAYYIASAADYIIAAPTTITGSIGVIIRSVNLKNLTDNIGIKDASIKSGDNKDLLNPMLEMTPEQERLISSVVDDMHNRFVNIVAQGRGLPEAKVRAIADGRIMTAGQALSAGLIDEIGYYDNALKKVEEHVGTSDFTIVNYTQNVHLFDIITSPSFIGSCAAETFRQISSDANTGIRCELEIK